MVWGAVSRAVRTPTRLDVDVRSVLPDGRVAARSAAATSSWPSRSWPTRQGTACSPTRSLSLDIAAYHNEYDRLRSQEPGPPIVLANGLRGRTNGLETQVTVRPTGWMRWQGILDAVRQAPRAAARAAPTSTGGAAEGNDPPHQLGLRTAHQPAASHRARRLSPPRRRAPRARGARLHRARSARGRGRSPTTSSSRWSGRNLLHASHPEFGRARSPARGDRAKSLRAGARELLMRSSASARVAVVLAGLARVRAAAPPPSPSGEYDVKAAYLYNFAKFVEWPAAVLSPRPTRRSRSACSGRIPFGRALDAIVARRTHPGAAARRPAAEGLGRRGAVPHPVRVRVGAGRLRSSCSAAHTLPAHAHRRRGAAVPHGRRAHQLLSRRQQRPLRDEPGERGAHGPANQLEADARRRASIRGRGRTP